MLCCFCLLEKGCSQVLPAVPSGTIWIRGATGLSRVRGRPTHARSRLELGDIHRELELARRVQLSTLPGAFPSSASFKVHANSQRAHAFHPAVLMAGMNSALCGNTQGPYVTAAYRNGGGAALAADGGVDVRLTRHLAFRAQVGFVHSSFATTPTTASNDRWRAGTFLVFRL